MFLKLSWRVQEVSDQFSAIKGVGSSVETNLCTEECHLKGLTAKPRNEVFVTSPIYHIT